MKKTEKLSLILGSQSPRRKQLFSYLGIPFEVKVSHAQEPEWKNESASEYTLALARLKAKNLSSELKESDILVTSDTTVVLENEILNKPKNREHAKEMLKKISKNKHIVCTSFIVYKEKIEIYSKTIVSEVICRELDDAKLDVYLDFSEYADKAGAYGIQGAALSFIKEIQGSYSNIMGFPIDYLIEFFENQWGLKWREYFV